MRTAIIILNYNSENDTIKYVKTLENYKCINKIVVVDNNSTSENATQRLKELENNKVDVIQTDKNGGYSYGNNFGLKYLEEKNEAYDYIAISNPDVEVSENAFEKCFEELEKNSKIAVVAPKMVDRNGIHIRRSAWKVRTPKIDMINSTRLNELLFYKKFKSGEYNENDFNTEKLEVEAVSGAFFVIKYEIFKSLRLF